MSEVIVAQRYAQALFSDSQEKGALDENYQQLQEIAVLIDKAEDFRHFIHNPVLPLSEKENVIKGLFADKISSSLFRFLNFLIFKGRLDLLKEIALAFEELYLNQQKKTRVVIQSADPLDDDLKSQLLAKLKSITHYELVPTWEIVPSMIGGVRVYAQGKLYEYSFKNELRDYKRKALERI
jgi:F-type H+-transporting ATPase subunit delta